MHSCMALSPTTCISAPYGVPWHEMDIAAQLATRVVLMDHGRIIADDSPHSILTNHALLKQSRLVQPVATQLFNELRQNCQRFFSALCIRMKPGYFFLTKLNILLVFA